MNTIAIDRATCVVKPLLILLALLLLLPSVAFGLLKPPEKETPDGTDSGDPHRPFCTDCCTSLIRDECDCHGCYCRPPDPLCGCSGAFALRSAPESGVGMVAELQALREFRDGFLIPYQNGRHYANLYEQYDSALEAIFIQRPGLALQAGLLIQELAGGIAPLVYGADDTPVISAWLVDEVRNLVDGVMAADHELHGGEMAARLQQELDALGLAAMVGKTYREAYYCVVVNPQAAQCN